MECMFTSGERRAIIDLINREVVVAVGCTEPAAVALCVARAAEILGREPESMDILLSANMLKNAMGVGIPGTGMSGLPIAVALGALCGRSEYGLEVLKDVTPGQVERGRAYIASHRIGIGLKEGACDMLYVEARLASGGDEACCIIEHEHTHIAFESRNGRIIKNDRAGGAAAAGESGSELSLRRVWDFAMTAPLEEIEFISSAAEMNRHAAEVSFGGEYGHGLGRMISGGKYADVMGGGVLADILSYTAGACDARMSGAMVPVMSNSGSGNQGISATLPVVVYGERCKASHEQMVRALILSHLTVIYIKQSLGRLSALCGCVVAATGSTCGITYLMGGGYDNVTYAVKNMIANLTGMICDGAKPSCALKVSSGVSMSVLSALLAMENRCVSSMEGIIDDDVDKCIHNLTRIGREGMTRTDAMILDIMTHKS